MFLFASLALVLFAELQSQIQTSVEAALIISASVGALIAAWKKSPSKKAPAKRKTTPRGGSVVAPMSQGDIDELGARR